MQMSPRYMTIDGHRLLRGLVLESESTEESNLLDECCGETVDEDGLIARGEFEVRLSDGCHEHYVYLTANS